MAEAVALARRVGSAIAERFAVPIYLYGEAARDSRRSHLEDIRRGQFERLALKMAQPEWVPDFGPRRPHPSAGASAVGARGPLIAYNINLATDRLEVARAIAAAIRQRGGGLPSVMALGIPLRRRHIVQVTTNLTDYHRTSLEQLFDAVVREAALRGVTVLESEFVGLVPAAALPPDAAARLRLAQFSDHQILEKRLRDVGIEL
jgi:glutamate formiminotransferase